MVRSAGSANPRLIDAFAQVPREHFVGPGPWQVFVGDGYVATPSDDPRFLYQDVLIALAPERNINNGQPSLHARCLAVCAPTAGESVFHLGAGTGYYSAILAILVFSVLGLAAAVTPAPLPLLIVAILFALSYLYVRAVVPRLKAAEAARRQTRGRRRPPRAPTSVTPAAVTHPPDVATSD